MGNKYHKPIISYWIVMLVATLDTIRHESVDGLPTMDRSNFALEPKGTIKTIEVPEDGDLVDCVDIYKQPTLNDPLMKDLQIEPSPSMIRVFNKSDHPLPKLIQSWHKYGECPKGTIPIRRAWKNNDPFLKRNHHDNDYTEHEYATAFVPTSTYFGASVHFNTWNPLVRKGADEFSLSQMWLASGTDPETNTIETGWMVYPRPPQNDTKTRFFIFWTSDHYNKTGCYNLECPGFVQTNPTISIGMSISPLSVYGGDQHKIYIAINRVRATQNWWLTFNDIEVGYFRKQIFTRMDDGAEEVEFGGEIVNQKAWKRHTTTQMGSGHFAGEGFGKASYIRNAMVVDRYDDLIPAKLSPRVTHPNCYNLQFGKPNTKWGSYFYYGGPGYSKTCP